MARRFADKEVPARDSARLREALICAIRDFTPEYRRLGRFKVTIPDLKTGQSMAICVSTVGTWSHHLSHHVCKLFPLKLKGEVARELMGISLDGLVNDFGRQLEGIAPSMPNFCHMQPFVHSRRRPRFLVCGVSWIDSANHQVPTGTNSPRPK